MEFLYVLFGISVVALVVLFIFVMKGAAKKSGGFQKEIKAPKGKKVEKTREEKLREKAELKAAMKAKKAEWKAEDKVFDDQCKANIKALRAEVKEK